MSGVYSVEDLLKLRASPLICKPPNLSAIEEIITSQDANVKKPSTRGRPDDSNNQTEGFQKRPLLDSQTKKSATDPERIVLGPPRRSFASSSARVIGKATQDGIEESVSTRERAGLRDRFKTPENADGKNFDRHVTDTNGRYGNRQERDGLQSDKPRRKHDDEDGEARPRREFDRERPKWAGRDERTGADDENEDDGKLSSRRDFHSRTKFEQPWFRHDRAGESLDDVKRDGERSEWRRDRGRDREWDRPARAEADPEWMADAEREEPAQIHTQEEFQRWKERMKASGANANESKTDSALPTLPDQREEIAAKPSTTIEADDSMDKFFARYTESKTVSEPKTAATKAPTKTRFASLFSPPPESQPKHTPPPPPAPPPVAEPTERSAGPQSVPTSTDTPSNTDADQAGFARILEMLQTRNTNPPPQAHESKTRTPLYSRDNQTGMDAEKSQPAPNLMSLFTQNESPQPHAIQTKSPTALERRNESKSPNESSHSRQHSNKDELLLNLLRQASLAPKPTPGPGPQHYEQRHPPGLFNLSEATNRSAMTRNQMVSPSQGPELGRSMFDDPAISSRRYRDEPSPHEPLTRRSTNPGVPPFFDDSYISARQGGPSQPQQKQSQPPVPPPGLGRLPGYDQPRIPLGWPNQQMPPQQQQPPPPPPPQQQQQQQIPPRQSAAPLGVGNIPRNMPPQFGGPNIPMQQNPNQSQRAPQRQYGGDSGMPPNFPPGMGPPMGFMGNGPPPGFPGAPPPGYGRFQGSAEQPHNTGRAFMEMYGDAGRGGVRSGMPGYK